METRSKKFNFVNLNFQNFKFKKVKKENYFSLNKLKNLLPFNLGWNDIDSSDITSIHELFFLLDKNYVEDCYSFLRFNYVHEFIKFAISSPFWAKFLNLSLKFNRSKQINGFISSNFRKIILNHELQFCTEINFLCLQKNLRKKLFVQDLIKEITRRLNCFGINTAIYTTGLPFKNPLVEAHYFYFSINSLKNTRFCKNFSDKIIPSNDQKNFKTEEFNCFDTKSLNNHVYLKNIRKQFLKKRIYKHFDENDFFYWTRFIKGVKYSFLKKNDFSNDKNLLVSFYSLPCKTIKFKKTHYFYDAYFYYGLQLTMESFLIKEGIDLCRKLGFDLFYILEGQYPETILEKVGFQKSESKLQYYLLGIEYEGLKPSENSLIFF